MKIVACFIVCLAVATAFSVEDVPIRRFRQKLAALKEASLIETRAHAGATLIENLQTWEGDHQMIELLAEAPTPGIWIKGQDDDTTNMKNNRANGILGTPPKAGWTVITIKQLFDNPTVLKKAKTVVIHNHGRASTTNGLPGLDNYIKAGNGDIKGKNNGGGGSDVVCAHDNADIGFWYDSPGRAGKVGLNYMKLLKKYYGKGRRFVMLQMCKATTKERITQSDKYDLSSGSGTAPRCTSTAPSGDYDDYVYLDLGILNNVHFFSAMMADPTRSDVPYAWENTAFPKKSPLRTPMKAKRDIWRIKKKAYASKLAAWKAKPDGTKNKNKYIDYYTRAVQKYGVHLAAVPAGQPLVINHKFCA